MANLIDVTRGVNQAKELLGIGGWELNTASFSVPAQKRSTNPSVFGLGLFDVDASEKDVITFLDMDTLLKDYGINLNLQSVPILQADQDIANFFARGGDSNPDVKGDTLYQVQQDDYSNQLITYNLPDSKPVVQSWGREVTTFNVTMLLANEDYLDKLRYVKDILSRNLDENGGTLTHPLYGTLKNVFVDKFSVVSQSSPFNASAVKITFITGEQAEFGDSNTNWVDEASTWISRANSALSVLSTVNNIQEQVEASLPFTGDNSFYSGNRISVTNTTNEDTASGRSLVTSQLSPDLSSAITQARKQNIELNKNIQRDTQATIEKVCQFGNVKIKGYGNGGLSSTTTSTLTINDPLTIEDTETTDSTGTTTRTTYTTLNQNDDGTYEVRESITTVTPIERPQNKREIETEVNNLVSYLGIQSRLNPANYNTYTSLISSLKNLANEVFNKGTTIFVELDRDMLPLTAAKRAGMSWNEFWKLNKDRIKGHLKLPKGFKVSIRREST
jgi:hypothetical protein